MHDWKNIITDKTPEGKQATRIADELFEKYKDNDYFFRILSALMARYHEYTSAPSLIVKPTRSLRTQKDIALAMEKSGVMSFRHGSVAGRNNDLLDHMDMGKDAKGEFHVVGRPYGLHLDLETLDRLRTLVENGMHIAISADMVHFPGWTIEIDMTKKKL
jgi:hypothetical protein